MKKIVAAVLAATMLAGTGLAETKGTGADIRMDELGGPGTVSLVQKATEKEGWARKMATILTSEQVCFYRKKRIKRGCRLSNGTLKKFYFTLPNRAGLLEMAVKQSWNARIARVDRALASTPANRA